MVVRVKYAIVFVSDMKRAVSFYRDEIGLPLNPDGLAISVGETPQGT